MKQQVINEGRVVGYSAYEVYLRQFLAENPDGVPASEREWLASNIAMGNSILVKIDPAQHGLTNAAMDKMTVIDIPLPATSRICAANTIYASLFNGQGFYEEGKVFAKSITDYGDLLTNTATTHPAAEVHHGNINETYVPHSGNTPISEADRSQLRGYLAIQDGLVIQPGKWETVEAQQGMPGTKFTPFLDEAPTLRIQFRGPVENPMQLLLTGFTLRHIVEGETGLSTGGIDTLHPEDGDFLGPTLFPWANKIIFLVPSQFLNYIIVSQYVRSVNDQSAKTSTNSAIVDLEDSAILKYYEDYLASHPGTSLDKLTEKLSVTEVSSWADSIKVLAVYSYSTDLPPALYAVTIGATGEYKLAPVDTVAPGTFKVFTKDEFDAAKKFNEIPGCKAIIFDNNIMCHLVGDQIKPIIQVTSESATLNNSNRLISATALPGDARMIKMIQSGSLFYLPYIAANVQNQTGAPTTGTAVGSKFGWTEILRMLANCEAIDLFGDNGREFLSHLPDLHGRQLVLGNGGIATTVPEFQLNRPIDIRGNYISVNGIRLYISKSAPSGDIPDGSLGIGW